jgi:hypothetical protein
MKRDLKTEKAFEFFTKNIGKEFSLSQLSEFSGWSIVTIKTYLSKKWKGIIDKIAKDKYILKGFEKFSLEDFIALQTQVLSNFTTEEKIPEFDYDVTLSFAGEDREYVEKVAHSLRELGIKVFYDKYYEADLWGKNLYTHLDEIYQNTSKYCIIFVSKFYRDKVWTNHERESAQARAFGQKGEYILPVKFDDTKIPGIRPTIGYIDGQKHSPIELSQILIKKLGLDVQIEIDNLIQYLSEWLGNYEIKQEGINLIFYSEHEDHYASFPLRLMLEMYRAGLLENMFLIPGIVPN